MPQLPVTILRKRFMLESLKNSENAEFFLLELMA
jgi:hypothetical protein